MQMTITQKMRAVLGALSSRSDIKRLLIRQYWNRQKTFVLDFAGVHAVFSTEDFYSNYWFYGPQTQINVYEPAVTRLLISRLSGARCFSDLGANLGYYSVIAALVLKNAPVFAFELDSTLGPIIERNLQLNGCTSAKVISGAVGEADGEVVCYTPHPFGFIERITGVNTEPFRVQLAATTVSLDKYFGDGQLLPDFLKIDVDGAEMNVLRGMSRVLAQSNVQMLLEVHPFHLQQFGSTANAVLSFLHERAFRTYRLVHDPVRNLDATIPLREIHNADELTGNISDMVFVTRRAET
jgi:FkbM family methyltransferase